MLNQEIQTFAARLPELLTHSAGRWALVRAGAVALFDSERDALTAGALAYGMAPYLVRQVALVQPRPLLHLVPAHELHYPTA